MKNKTILLYAVIFLLICLSLLFVLIQRKDPNFIEESSLNKIQSAIEETGVEKRTSIKNSLPEDPGDKEKTFHSDLTKDRSLDTLEDNSLNDPGPEGENEFGDSVPEYEGDSPGVNALGVGLEAQGPGGENEFDGIVPEYDWEGPSAHAPGVQVELQGPDSGFENELIEAPEYNRIEYIGDGPEIYLQDMEIEPPGSGPEDQTELTE